MCRANEQDNNPNPAEQLRLFSQVELAEGRCPSASQKNGIKPHKARRQDVEERFIKSAGAIQPKLPGL